MKKVILAAAVLTAAWLSGCSDDVVCPDIEPVEATLFVSASLTQSIDGRTETSFAEVVCTGDPLPSTLIAYINGRSLSDVGPAQDPGLRATFEDNVVLWEPGTACSLGVTTDFGYATSVVAVPAHAAAAVPLESALGETLTISWNDADGADYYRVTARLVSASRARDGHRDYIDLESNTRELSVAFGPADLTFAGHLSGVVESVTGPFPEGGSEGNVSGDGWGFFSARYSESDSYFQTTIYDPLDRMRPSK